MKHELDIGALREKLREMRREIEAVIESSAETRKVVELDQSSVGRLSRMDALQRQAMAVAAQARRQDQLRRIDTALRRIEDNTYGECVECGGAIEPARLSLDPSIAFCLGCARQRR